MKNSTLTFVTGNNGKFKEVERYINELAPTITLKQAAIDLPECQSLDIRTVALGKAQKAWELLQAPVLIDDGGIYLERYHHVRQPKVLWISINPVRAKRAEDGAASNTRQAENQKDKKNTHN